MGLDGVLLLSRLTTFDPLRQGEGVLIHQETIEIVQRGIPGLADFDPARISFQKKVEAQPTAHWASILDGAWEHFGNNPPSTLKVVVADLPGDKQLREYPSRHA